MKDALNVWRDLMREVFLFANTEHSEYWLQGASSTGREILKIVDGYAKNLAIRASTAGERLKQAEQLVKAAERLLACEQAVRVPVVAVSLNLKGCRAHFHDEAKKVVTELALPVKNLPKPLRSRHLWEMLHDALQRRAAKDLKEWHQQTTFKTLGVGLHAGELKFVYSYVSPEHGLVLYRLPVQEDDLPDLILKAEA